MKNNERPGVQRIAAERERQKNHHHWTAKHDDEHKGGELAMAATCYAANAAYLTILTPHQYAGGMSFFDPFPWPNQYADARNYSGNVLKFPANISEQIRLLEKAGALIAAEIDRLIRLQKRQAEEESEGENG